MIRQEGETVHMLELFETMELQTSLVIYVDIAFLGHCKHHLIVQVSEGLIEGHGHHSVVYP